MLIQPQVLHEEAAMLEEVERVYEEIITDGKLAITPYSLLNTQDNEVEDLLREISLDIM